MLLSLRAAWTRGVGLGAFGLRFGRLVSRILWDVGFAVFGYGHGLRFPQGSSLEDPWCMRGCLYEGDESLH